MEKKKKKKKKKHASRTRSRKEPSSRRWFWLKSVALLLLLAINIALWLMLYSPWRESLPALEVSKWMTDTRWFVIAFQSVLMPCGVGALYLVVRRIRLKVAVLDSWSGLWLLSVGVSGTASWLLVMFNFSH